MQELMPAVEKQFRVIRRAVGAHAVGRIDRRLDRRARTRSSTRTSTAARSRSCPDARRLHVPPDRRTSTRTPTRISSTRDWMKVERPNQRRPDGNIQSMMKDENRYELVVGDKSRSGGQWDIWEATYSARWGRRLSEADLEQGDRGDRQGGRRDVEEVRPPPHPADELGDARPEGRAQAESLRRRHGLVLPERRRREAERVPAEGATTRSSPARSCSSAAPPHCWGPRRPGAAARR